MKKLITTLMIFAFPAILHAEPIYKCKPSDDLTAYSDAPCKAVPNKKITVKENTLDHSQLRKDKNYTNALPKPVAESASTGGGVSVVPLAKRDDTRSSTSIANDSNSTAPSSGGAGGTPAVTSQPWQ